MIDLRPSRTRSGAWAGMAWNVERWRALRQVERFAHRRLAPVEVVILARYREALSGRVLELGCGAGRIIGYLLALGGEVHGIDISPRMVERCRRAYPGANVREGDLRALERAGGRGAHPMRCSRSTPCSRCWPRRSARGRSPGPGGCSPRGGCSLSPRTT